MEYEWFQPYSERSNLLSNDPLGSGLQPSRNHSIGLGPYTSHLASPWSLSLLPTPFEDSGRATQIVDKGRIQVGYDADLVLVDMNLSKTIRNEDQLTRTRWSPWAGQTLKGWPVRTLVRG